LSKSPPTRIPHRFAMRRVSPFFYVPFSRRLRRILLRSGTLVLPSVFFFIKRCPPENWLPRIRFFCKRASLMFSFHKTNPFSQRPSSRFFFGQDRSPPPHVEAPPDGRPLRIFPLFLLLLPSFPELALRSQFFFHRESSFTHWILPLMSMPMPRYDCRGSSSPSSTLYVSSCCCRILLPSFFFPFLGSPCPFFFP